MQNIAPAWLCQLTVHRSRRSSRGLVVVENLKWNETQCCSPESRQLTEKTLDSALRKVVPNLQNSLQNSAARSLAPDSAPRRPIWSRRSDLWLSRSGSWSPSWCLTASCWSSWWARRSSACRTRVQSLCPHCRNSGPLLQIWETRTSEEVQALSLLRWVFFPDH